MAQRQVRYYFGRFNLITPGRDKLEVLRNALASDAVLEVRGQSWGFYEFSELRSSHLSLLTGFLVKYKPRVEEEIVVPERHALEEKAIENRVTAKSRFFLHANSGLIVYHPAGSQIPRQLFASRFVEVFQHALQNFFVNADIQSIEEQFKFIEELKSFTTVHQVSIYLHPSNPGSRDVWRDVDQRIKTINATSYKEKYESDRRKGTLRVIEDTEISQKIAMAEDGYGKVEVTGEKGGKIRKISTSDNPLSVLAPPDDERPEQVLPALRDTITSFLERFRQ
jgi:hypothetical protein